MGAALVAFIDREHGKIVLDPNVRPGDRLDARGEAVLLHTTAMGHPSELAQDCAATLRHQGWRVAVRAVPDLVHENELARWLSEQRGQSRSEPVAIEAKPEVEPTPVRPEAEQPSQTRRLRNLRVRYCGTCKGDYRSLGQHQRSNGHTGEYFPASDTSTPPEDAS